MRFLQFLIIILLIGCSFNNERSVKDHSMYWHKNSAEYKALCLQAYNIAKKKLELELSKDYEKPLAIIADLDETIFDNTPYNEMLIKENKSYNQENWSEWVNKKIATAIPGSLDKTNKERWEVSVSLKDNFGEKFILLPNLIYGDWEIGFE